MRLVAFLFALCVIQAPPKLPKVFMPAPAQSAQAPEAALRRPPQASFLRIQVPFLALLSLKLCKAF